VKPDITVFGKILGGGFPVGAFSAGKGVMERLDSHIYERPRYSFHGGTFTANPITMTAGMATLKILEDGQLIDRLNRLGQKIRDRLGRIFEASGIAVQVTGAGSLFNVHFTKGQVKNAVTAFKADRNRLLDYHLNLIANGIFILPTHNAALSTAHSEQDIEKLFSETEEYAKQSKSTHRK
jgi:glutamate-1-semialdehyde 2,1-aminomutase